MRLKRVIGAETTTMTGILPTALIIGETAFLPTIIIVEEYRVTLEP